MNIREILIKLTSKEPEGILHEMNMKASGRKLERTKSLR